MTAPLLTWRRLPARQLLQDASLQAAWNRLNTLRGDLPILDSAAVCAALHAFGTGAERLLVGRHGDAEPAAMCIVQRCGFGRWQTFQPSQLPLGCWVAEPAQPLRALAESMLRGPLAPCLVFSVTQIDPLHATRADDGPRWTHDDYIETGWIDIAGGFDGYWAQRGKNLRSNLRKQRNRLTGAGVVGELVEIRDAGEMAAAVSRYSALESAGWKASGGTAIHPGNAQGQFYRSLLEQAAARGEAVVYDYRFGADTVAMHLCLQRGGQLLILKTTYDERVDKALSPALLLHQDELQRLFDAGQVRRLEYFGRFMEWHSRWTDDKRTLHHLTCYRWAWLKRLKQLAAARRRVLPQAESQAAGIAVGTP